MNAPPRRRRRTPLVLLVFVLAPAVSGACGGEAEESPFPLWDMRVGMPLSELDSMTLNEQGDRYACAPAHTFYKRCRIVTRGTPGEMRVVLDSLDRVIELTFYPNTYRGSSHLAALGKDVEGAWARTGEPGEDVKSGDFRTRTWRSEDGRWSAEMRWRYGTPALFRTTDEKGVVGYRYAEAMAPSDDAPPVYTAEVVPYPGAAPEERPTRVQVRAELRRLVDAQERHHRGYRRYADRVSQLRIEPPLAVDIAIREANEVSFWASARTGSGVECRVWGGAEPVRWRELGLPSSQGAPEC